MAYNYTLPTLKQAIVDWLEDDGDEFVAHLNEMVQLAEQAILTALPFSIFDETATGTLVSASLTKPSAWVSTINLFVTENGAQRILEPKPWDYVQLLGGVGTPRYYAEDGETTLRVAPVPTSAPYTLRYIQRPASLVDVTEGQTTWISENIPEVLFWGCIVNAENFRKADARIDMAKGFYNDSVTLARQELRHLLRREYK